LENAAMLQKKILQKIKEKEELINRRDRMASEK
jgi:hypothetical protein